MNCKLKSSHELYNSIHTYVRMYLYCVDQSCHLGMITNSCSAYLGLSLKLSCPSILTVYEIEQPVRIDIISYNLGNYCRLPSTF